MANTPDYSWPPMEKRKVIGQRFKRLDGPQKSAGRAKYASDTRPKDMLFGAYLTNPHAHAKVLSVDTSAAEKTPGVKSVYVAAPAGTEMQYQGWEIAGVAATTEEVARDAARKIKVEYEVLPHVVNDADLGKAASRAKQGGEKLRARRADGAEVSRNKTPEQDIDRDPGKEGENASRAAAQ